MAIRPSLIADLSVGDSSSIWTLPLISASLCLKSASIRCKTSLSISYLKAHLRELTNPADSIMKPP
jgi:hypothetical protein